MKKSIRNQIKCLYIRLQSGDIVATTAITFLRRKSVDISSFVSNYTCVDNIPLHNVTTLSKQLLAILQIIIDLIFLSDKSREAAKTLCILISDRIAEE